MVKAKKPIYPETDARIGTLCVHVYVCVCVCECERVCVCLCVGGVCISLAVVRGCKSDLQLPRCLVYIN